jgi:hypothetical protein
MLVSPFRVFGIAARPQPSPPEVVLFWNWSLVQSMTPAEVSLLLVLRSRFAVSTCLGCAVFLPRAAADDCLGYRPRPLVELHLSSRVLPSNTYSAAATAKSSHGLPLPSALEEFEVHCARASQPASFRLQGLATLLTAYSLESRAGFVSHRQRSWDSPFGGFPSRRISAAFQLRGTHIPLARQYFCRRSVRPA